MVAAGCSPGVPGGDRPAPPAPVEAPVLGARVSADGRTVTLTVGGDPCSTVRRTDVDQRADRVVVAVFLAGPESAAPSCAGLTGARYEVPVSLDAPLGTRRLTTTAGGQVPTN